MARETSSVVGSGTIQGVAGILPLDARGVQPEGRGEWRGMNVVVVNPEDINSVPAFAVSGIAVGQTPVELIGANLNPLPRCKEVRIINNTASTTLFIGPNNDETELRLDGYVIEHGSGGAGDHPVQTILPLLHNASIWAVADTGDTIDVRILIL